VPERVKRMKILQLTKNQTELFADMDPLMMSEKLEFPGHIALGAVEREESTMEDIPAGLMICSLQEDHLVIEWLYIATEFRGQGIGEKFLLMAFEMAADGNLRTVCAYVNQEYGRNLVCVGEEDYFKEHLFTAEQELAGEWFVDLRTLSLQPFFKEKPDMGHYKLSSLAKLMSTQVREVMEILLHVEGVTTLYPMKKRSPFFDTDVSMLVYNKQEICGGMLVQSVPVEYSDIVDGKIAKKTKTVLYPILFCAKTEEAAKLLLYHVLQSVTEKYPKDMDFRIMLRNQEYKGLLNELFPMQQTKNKFLVADIAEYVEMKRQREKYKALENYL